AAGGVHRGRCRVVDQGHVDVTPPSRRETRVRRLPDRVSSGPATGVRCRGSPSFTLRPRRHPAAAPHAPPTPIDPLSPASYVFGTRTWAYRCSTAGPAERPTSERPRKCHADTRRSIRDLAPGLRHTAGDGSHLRQRSPSSVVSLPPHEERSWEDTAS